MGDDFRMRMEERSSGLNEIREIEDDSVVRVGNVIEVAGIRWQVTNITTLDNGDKQVSAIQLPTNYTRESRARAGRDAAWAAYPAGWPACACGLPVMDGHVTCGRAGCGGH